MIREVTGDILLSKAAAIAHGVAPGDHFSSGLALSLRERWPSMARDFRHYCHQVHPKPGGAWIWSGSADERGSVRIINLLTQEPAEHEGGHPGRATARYVNLALTELARIVGEENLRSLALPRLATGVGGLEWTEVRPLIDHHLAALGIPVLLYTTYKKDVAASEQLPAT
jgi:O-acetyl-ADP-ribose deacetylase (regulator of RNase III)